jgi:hypothetical protein
MLRQYRGPFVRMNRLSYFDGTITWAYGVPFHIT